MTAPVGSAMRGVTLVELVVVLAVLGTLTTMVLINFPRTRPRIGPKEVSDPIVRIRQHAIESGMPSGGRVALDGKVHAVLALPDGRVIADSSLRVDPFTGKPNERRP